jgi:hypothetical protein
MTYHYLRNAGEKYILVTLFISRNYKSISSKLQAILKFMYFSYLSVLIVSHFG